MPTLKEIKGRIGSVKSTLKITSAMKLVSSAKLRKAQMAIEAMRPYEEALQDILASVKIPGQAGNDAWGAGNDVETVMPDTDRASSDRVSKPTAIVAMASNSSLCGGFNANIIAKVRSERHPGDVVYSVGRKMADAMRRDGFPSPEDLNDLVERPAYSPAAALVEKLAREVEEGRYARVLLVYTHFASTARQVPVAEQLLPAVAVMPDSGRVSDEDVLIEPGKEELLESLLPKTLKLKLYAALLDSAAAEHAARTVAMQTATDNAENLLSELTLQYNKGRQQKITSEILDLAGGQTE
jgi:F-type H+-transporting ATPase subunit gamma